MKIAAVSSGTVAIYILKRGIQGTANNIIITL